MQGLAGTPGGRQPDRQQDCAHDPALRQQEDRSDRQPGNDDGAHDEQRADRQRTRSAQEKAALVAVGGTVDEGVTDGCAPREQAAHCRDRGAEGNEYGVGVGSAGQHCPQHEGQGRRNADADDRQRLGPRHHQRDQQCAPCDPQQDAAAELQAALAVIPCGLEDGPGHEGQHQPEQSKQLQFHGVHGPKRSDTGPG